jgi:hypothetical protein
LFFPPPPPLQSLFVSDHLSYKVKPVAGYTDVLDASAELIRDNDTVGAVCVSFLRGKLAGGWSPHLHPLPPLRPRHP